VQLTTERFAEVSSDSFAELSTDRRTDLVAVDAILDRTITDDIADLDLFRYLFGDHLFESRSVSHQDHLEQAG
jgi:hypothetical protein